MRRLFIWLIHIALLVIIAAAIVTCTSASFGTIRLTRHIPNNEVILNNRHVERLPFVLQLDSFRIEHYEGTDIPSDYISDVTIRELTTLRQQSFISYVSPPTLSVTISMNNPVTVRDVRFYQMSYDDDGQTVSLAVNRDPWGRTLVYLGYAMLAMALSLLMVHRLYKHPRIALGLFIAALVIAFLVFDSWQAPRPLPVLNSHWLLSHVTTIMLSYALFAVLAVMALLNRLRYWRVVLLVAVTLLSFGIMLGSVWADESWGCYWGWDPKETWALITLIIYSAPLHLHRFAFFKSPSRLRWYFVVAIASVLMTYFGVNYLLGGLHSYA